MRVYVLRGRRIRSHVNGRYYARALFTLREKFTRVPRKSRIGAAAQKPGVNSGVAAISSTRVFARTQFTLATLETPAKGWPFL